MCGGSFGSSGPTSMTYDEMQRAMAMQQGGLGGQHWNSASQIYGNPLGQSGLGALGAQGLAQSQAFQAHLASLHAQHAQQNAYVAQFTQQGKRAEHVKHEGIRAGEIIGYRVWLVIKGFLHSLTQPIAWAPGEVMKGDVSTYGVYAFNLMGRALGDMTDSRYDEGGVFRVVGSVQMWGEIIEHEFGYRSEFAKIVSLDHIQGADESALQALRVKYGLASAE